MTSSSNPRRPLATIVMALASTTSMAGPTATSPMVAVGPQYDTTHVYVAPEAVDDFVRSFVATFGGASTKQVVATVTPTPSSTTSQLVQTPHGTISVFGFKTPIPYPFGLERNGYLVTDLDKAIRSARDAGADVLVSAFPDPIGRDAIVQWPGGVNLQLYWHTAHPAYRPLQTIPENRIYVSPDRVAAFVRSFTRFSHGKVVSDKAEADGIEIGQPGETYRRLRIESPFGKMAVMVTDGHLPYPYGHETTGYEVANVEETLASAQAAGVKILTEPIPSEDRTSAVVEFPGGYVAEIHSTGAKALANAAGATLHAAAAR